MIKDILKTAVMLSVLLFAMFVFFGFVALMLELGRVLPQYIGVFMTAIVVTAITMLFFTLSYYIIKRNE